MTVCDILEILPLVFSWAFYFLLRAAAPGFKFTFILGKIVNKNVDIWNNLLSGQNIWKSNNLKVVWEQENQRA
jgi:hypothetical protein